MRVVEPITVLYIGGAGRSGSTLLDMLLGNAPSFFSVGEVRFFWEYLARDDLLCGCGMRLRQCEFWSQIYSSLLKQGLDMPHLASLSHHLNRTRNALWMIGNVPRKLIPALSELRQATTALYKLISATSGASVIVDSSKVPSQFAILRQLDEIDLRLLHLVRDGRAVAYSWSKRPKKELAKTSLPATMPRHIPFRSIVTWAVENASIAQLGQKLPHVVIRYEDFSHNPHAEMQRALTALGLDSADANNLCEADLVLQPTHSVGGNPIRFTTREAVIKPDLEWQEKMPRSIKTILWLLAMPMMRHYEYSLE
jgi:hypothetical protein